MGSNSSVHRPQLDKIKHGPGPGEIDVGGYRISLEDSIGKGTFGSVCQAHVIDTGLPIAAKGILVADRWSRNNELISMAMEEGARMRACSHPNIVKLYDHYEHGSKVWLFMELCDLGDLNHHLDKNPEMPFSEKLRIMGETTSAVAYLHHRDIIHRDIKPENILIKMVDDIPVVKLGDFGYAKIYDYTISQPTFSTQINRSTAGTPAFWAPEFFLNRENLKYTASVDIFSLGLIFTVVYNYGPANKSTFPISVESKQKCKEEVFGREMAEKFQKDQPLPNLVTADDSDDRIIVRLKTLISAMTAFESSSRNKIGNVETQLICLQEQLNDDVSFDTIMQEELKKVKEAQLSDQPRSIKIIDNEIWSCQCDGITVYNEELQQLRLIAAHCKRPSVRSVVLLSDDTVAVACRRHLYQSSKTGKFIRTITEESYEGLAIHNDQLLAADRRSPAIHVYSCRTWQRLRNIGTPCSDKEHERSLYPHRLCVNDTNITLSCYWQNKIYVLDPHGTLKQSHGSEIQISTQSSSPEEVEHSTINSALRKPLICQEDKEGAVLVADAVNDRLLILTPGKQWRFVSLSDDVLKPIDAVWWKGRLYVITDDDKILTVFQ